MSYNAVPTVATGDTWSAANHNTYIRDNFAAGVPDIFTAAGDIAYATAANAAAPLAIGTPGQVLLSSSDSLPKWSDALNIAARQGGSAMDWNIGGTTNYLLPGLSVIQIGGYQFTVNGATNSGTTITYPIAFAKKPKVFLTVEFISGDNTKLFAPYTSDVGENTFGINIRYSAALSGSTVFYIHWYAIGPVA